MGTGKGDQPYYEKDENTQRGNWSGKVEFLLSAVGYAVGLGNVWRFPYKAYSNGGASFLIPYVIMLATAGLPMFYLEMSIGQFASLGPISIWKVVPLFKGLGYAMVIISALVCVYYNIIIAYTLYYLFASFTSKLPWQECHEDWIQYGCQNRETNLTVIATTAAYCSNSSLKATDEYNVICKPRTPSEMYWKYGVLDISDSVSEGSDEIRWQLALCLLLAWIIIFVCIIRGIKSTGKVVYFTATFPYIVLIILCIRNALLPGSLEGIKFYLIPDWNRLKEARVWHSAATQIFYSLGIAFGGLQTMASYNRFKNNIHRDAVLVAIMNCGTSVFAGFVIFSVLGFMSHQTGVPIENVAADGPGLAFIAYPEGLAMMPVAPLWSVLFFFMLFTLGLDTQFVMMETVISALQDEFPFFQKGRRKMWLTLVLCICLFLIGLPQCARNGIYIMTLFDWYSAGFSLFIIGLLEIIAIAYIYGLKRFGRDLELMMGSGPNIYWLATWYAITPLVLTFVLIFSVYDYVPAYYADYEFPAWFNNIGWGLFACSVIFIPLLALIEYCKAHAFIETMRVVMNPERAWGPALPQYRSDMYQPEDAPQEDLTTGNGHCLQDAENVKGMVNEACETARM